MSVNYVVVEKAAIPPTAALRTDHEEFYNFAAGLVLERILLCAKHWPGGARDVKTRFGHVRGFDHSATTRYFAIKRSQEDRIPWALQRGAVEWDGMGNWDGLQAADQFAGMLNAAISEDPFGGFEAGHLLQVRHLIRRSQTGNSWDYGFKWLGNAPTVQGLPWWPPAGL